MTLDRTKKYKVGEVVFECVGSGRCPWIGDLKNTVINVDNEGLALLNPVEVEEPLKWSFEWDAESSPFTLMAKCQEASPDKVHEGNWRHEVVSTRIG